MSAVASQDRRNITPFDEIVLEIDALYEQIAGVTEIESEDQHEAASKLYDDLHEAGKKADELRKEEVKPLDDAKAAIQERYHPLIGDTKKGKGKVVRGKEVLGNVLAAWRKKVAEEKRLAAERAAREAEEERQKAIAAMQASAGDLEAREEAERQLELAKEAAAFARREDKRATTGLGLRTYWVATMTDPRAAVAAMWKSNPQAFVDLAQELADKAVRSGIRNIDGFTITEEKKAI